MSIELDIKPVNSFDDEAATIAAQPKEDYSNTPGMDQGPAAEGMTEAQFEKSQAAAADSAQGEGSKARSAKMAFNFTDMLVPRVASMFIPDVSHTELQAPVDDRQDIINAYEAFLEYYDYDFDNPIVNLVVILGMVYGLPIVEKAGQARGRKKRSRTMRTSAPAANRVDSHPDNEGNAPETVQAETVETSTDDGIEDAKIIAEIPTCQAPTCAKALKKGQKKYCSKQCRMDALNAKP